MNELTVEQKTMIRYFWEEYRDITRYVDFEKLRPLFEKEYPELIKAWDDYRASIKVMNAVIKTL